MQFLEDKGVFRQFAIASRHCTEVALHLSQVQLLLLLVEDLVEKDLVDV